MRLTKRGRIVFGSLFIGFMVFMIALAGRFDAIDQCATFQANNDYQNALTAGCSFEPDANGVYHYTWTP